MKVWKLVSGVLSIVLSVFIVFQSMLVGIVNTAEENGQVGGSAGLIVAILMLTFGIISIATRNGGKGGDIAILIMAVLASLMGFLLAGQYGDLYIWSFWCLVNAILALINIIRKVKIEKQG